MCVGFLVFFLCMSMGHVPDTNKYYTILYLPSIAKLFSDADDDLFHRINTNSNHVLQPYLPDNNELPYQLRTRHHNRSLIIKTKFLNDTDFIVRINTLIECLYCGRYTSLSRCQSYDTDSIRYHHLLCVLFYFLLYLSICLLTCCDVMLCCIV